MRWKMHALLATMLFWLMATTGVGGEPIARITGPKESPMGDLIVLDCSQSTGCTQYLWLLVNSDKSFLPVDNGLRCVFSSGTPGRFIFVLVVAGVSNNNMPVAAIAKHELTITSGPAPPTPAKLIDSFTASHESVAKGEAVTFGWSTKGASQVRFNNVDVMPTGTQVVAINETATYTLTASDATRVETQQRRVVVTDKPPPSPTTDVATKAKELALAVQGDAAEKKAEATAMAQNYRNVAEMIDKSKLPVVEGAIATRQEAQEKVSAFNKETLGARQSAWSSFFSGLATYLTQREASGAIKADIYSQAEVFRQIASGLEALP